MNWISTVLLCTAMLCSTCAVSPPEPPNPQGCSASSACEHLAAIGCAEGEDPDCAVVLQHVLDSRLRNVDVGCMCAARDQIEARACPAVVCP